MKIINSIIHAWKLVIDKIFPTILSDRAVQLFEQKKQWAFDQKINKDSKIHKISTLLSS